MLDANDISERHYAVRIAVLLQNYFNTIKTTNTLRNRNVVRYNLRIINNILSLKSAEKQYSYVKTSLGDNLLRGT